MTRGSTFGTGEDRTTHGLRATAVGLIVGVTIGVVAAFGGFVAFLIVVLLGAVGAVVGLVVDGRIDITSLVDRNRRDR